ncbi:VWA domain-containing protein [Streptomyces sp. NPDC053493]|uniref:VWA domain-containing protein n=1 Tax=Streptomyces sp. NPDC053493 TaxID=3365705 RepID=UPI0037D1E841
MGIRSLLRKVFARDRADIAAPDTPAPSVPPQSAARTPDRPTTGATEPTKPTGEPSATDGAADAATAAAGAGGAATPEPLPESAAERAAADLVAAAFDNPQIPAARRASEGGDEAGAADATDEVKAADEVKTADEGAADAEPTAKAAEVEAEAAEVEAEAESPASAEDSSAADAQAAAPAEAEGPTASTDDAQAEATAAAEADEDEPAAKAEPTETPATTEDETSAEAEEPAASTDDAQAETTAAAEADEDEPAAKAEPTETPATTEAATSAEAEEPAASTDDTAAEAPAATADDEAEPAAGDAEAVAAADEPTSEEAAADEVPARAEAETEAEAEPAAELEPAAAAAEPEPAAAAPAEEPKEAQEVQEPQVKEPSSPALPLARLKADAPHLVDAYKAAGTVLKKQGLADARAAVYLVVDRSGSMRPYFKDGSVQRLAEQTVALAAHLTPDAAVTAVFFSTDIDGTAELRPADTTPTRVEELNATLGRMGRTNYHRAVEEVLALHQKSEDPARPALVVFQTDGAPESKTAATQALTDAADGPVTAHWRFTVWGDEDNKAFDYLRKLATPRTGVHFAGPAPAATPHAAFYRELLAGWSL